jgi:hypothetical protein
MQNDIRLSSVQPSDTMATDIWPNDIMSSDIMPTDIWPDDIRPKCTAPFFAWKPILRKIYNPSQQIKAKESFFLPIFFRIVLPNFLSGTLLQNLPGPTLTFEL